MSELHDRLRAELSLRKGANPRFSLRRMAGLLEMSPAHLSLFLAGRKGLSPRKLRHIASVLQISDRVIADFVRKSGRAQHSLPRKRRILSSEENTILSDWYFYAILSLARTHRNSADPRSIARSLGITPEKARDAVAWLKQKKILSTAGGKLRQISDPLRTAADIPSEQVRAFHRRNLQLAETKLETVPVPLREFGSITFAVDPRRLRALKEHVRRFLEEAAAITETTSATAVYSIAVQLFPLSETKELDS